jgi:hypothetical protein
LEANSDVPLSIDELEREVELVRDSLFHLETTRTLSEGPARSFRHFGRLGLSVPLQATAEGRYRYRTKEEPAVVLAIRARSPETLLDVDYVAPRDVLQPLQAVTLTRPERNSAGMERESRERVLLTPTARRGTAANSSSVELDVRRFSTHRRVVLPGFADAAFALIAGPVSRTPFIDEVWDRVVATCRLEGPS